MKIPAAILIATALAAGADLRVGTATANPGQRATGFLEIPAGVDAATNIPVIVINGVRPGPKLALVAGAHGTEYASILALEKLAQVLNPAEIHGAVIIVPLINLASFNQKVPHVNPVDGKNMNRMYPGKPEGTQTERALWAVGEQVVKPCDALIDLHGGDLDENLRRYSYLPVTGNAKLDAESKAMVVAFGLDHIIIQKIQGAAVPGATSVSRFSIDLGKPTIIAEAGHAGTTNADDIDALVDGAQNVMRQLKMLPGAPKIVEHAVWLGQITSVKSEHNGIFYPLALPEAYVAQGQRIGYITDYFGNKIADVPAPISGVVQYICSVPSMKKGDTVINVAEIAAEPR